MERCNKMVAKMVAEVHSNVDGEMLLAGLKGLAEVRGESEIS